MIFCFKYKLSTNKNCDNQNLKKNMKYLTHLEKTFDNQFNFLQNILPWFDEDSKKTKICSPHGGMRGMIKNVKKQKY